MDSCAEYRSCVRIQTQVHRLNIKDRRTVDNNPYLFAGHSACSIGDGYVIGSLIVYIGFVYA